MEDNKIAGSIILPFGDPEKLAENRLRALDIAFTILPKMKKGKGYGEVAKSRIEVLTEGKEIAEDILDWAYGK